MAILQPYIDAAGLGANVVAVTGKSSDALKSGAFAAWIYSATGKLPTVVNVGGGRVKLVLSEKQHEQLGAYLRDLTRPSKDQPTVELELKPTLVPFALRYAIPYGVAAFFIGYVVRSIVR